MKGYLEDSIRLQSNLEGLNSSLEFIQSTQEAQHSDAGPNDPFQAQDQPFRSLERGDCRGCMKDVPWVHEGFKTYEEYKNNWIYEWNKDVPWVHERPLTKNGVWKEPTPVKHHCKPFNYKSGCSEWPTCSWKDDGYCNRGNLPGAYIIGNTLRYQDLEWYEALKDGKLKEEALKNKAITDGRIDEDDESSNEGWKRWDDFDNTNRDNEESENEMEHEEEERCEVFDDHERPVCYIRRFEMVKYSFRDDEEYVAIKENEYDDLTNTSKEAIHTYQEIFRMMDEGWKVTRTE
ncbi:hypothetical protein Tco_1280910 [Tanacetum coccineum]